MLGTGRRGRRGRGGGSPHSVRVLQTVTKLSAFLQDSGYSSQIGLDHAIWPFLCRTRIR